MLSHGYFWKFMRVCISLPLLCLTILSWKAYASISEYTPIPNDDFIEAGVAYPLITAFAVAIYIYTGKKAIIFSKK